MSYDAAGEVTSRGLSSGTAQNLTWDGFGRLVKVDQRDSNNQGYNWVTVYDGLGRRIQTAYSDATENQTTSLPLNIYYYYDPEVPFLEIGRDYNGRTWNLFGPDRSGFYGGAEGIGGMETTYAENGRETYGILKNFFGDSLGNMNALGLYAWGNVLGGYGAMPGSSVNEDLVPQWRGQYLDWTGLYYFGARYYDPTEGRFISADPLGHDASMSLYDYCNGDPINELDPDGMDAVALGHGWYYFVMHDNHRMDALNLHFINNKNSDYSEQCATGAQFLTGTFINGNFHDAPSTRTWRQGNPVGPNTPLGTMIATGWIDGRYPSAPPSAYAEGERLYGQTMNHTGIFKGMNPDGTIEIFDQYIGKSLGKRPVKNKGWSVVTSNQKYDPLVSESFEADQSSKPPSTMKSCGH
jgi:RHS repeat-associated protein